MDLKQYFSPQLVKKYNSKINKDIQIVNFGGQPRLDMGGLTQSGQIIQSIWNSGFKNLLPKDFSPKKVLILGFGAGSAAKLISHKWPGVSITGVEIDPTVIKIAKQHFNADKTPNLHIVNIDAYDFVLSEKDNDYDLCIVDCYLGDQVPQKLQSVKFLKKLKKISTYVLINRLFWADYKKTSLEFLDLLDTHFSTKTTRTPSNFLISIS